MEERPRLRPVEAFPIQQGGKTVVCVRDPLHIGQTLVISPAGYFILGHLDGRHTLLDVQEAYCKQFGALLLSEELRELIGAVDQSFLLDNAKFLERRAQVVEEFRSLATRPPAHAGTVYRPEPRDLEMQLHGYFRDPEGPGGVAEAPKPAPRAVVAPHIDFHRGGPWYAWAYRELMESEGADLYVLLGTSHCGGSTPFILTEKDFATPWGPVETDKEFVRGIQAGCSEDLFADEYLHRGEHSLEFQVVFLKYASVLAERGAGNGRPFKIVPILVSSFQPMVAGHILPEQKPGVAALLRGLRDQIARESRRVCLIAGVDLAHVGAQFGDREKMTPSFLQWVEAEDLRLIDRLVALDGPGFFQEVAKDQDRRRICGFSPLYTLIHLLEGSRGRLLRYRQAFTPETNSAVTFTSVVFE